MIEQQPITGLATSTLSRDSVTSVDIIKLLDKLEELVEDSLQVFGRAVWVNADEFFVYTNKIRAFLPEDMKRASRISRDSEKLLEDAQQETERVLQGARAEAERYLQEAHSRALQMVAHNEIRRQAEQDAERIMLEAEQNAREVKAGADQYAREVLASLDTFLGRIMGTIQRGRAKLDHKEGVSARK